MRRALLLVFLAATAAQANAMKPGLWEISTRMHGAGMPAMPEIPEAQRKQMEAMGIRMPGASGPGMQVTSKTCITKEQAERHIPPQSDEDRRQRCEQKDVKTSGKTTTWKIECAGERKMSGHGSITLASPESYKGESTITLWDPRQGPMTITQAHAGKWLASACK